MKQSRPTRSLLLGALLLCSVAAHGQQAPLSGAMQETGRTLEDFFLAALDHSPRLRIAEERKQIGEARRRGATGQLLPRVSANSSFSDNRQRELGVSTTFSGERYTLQLQQVLFNWQAFAQRRAAISVENQYEAEYFDELGIVFTQVAEHYFNVLLAEDALSSNEAELSAIRNQRDQAVRLHELRMIPVTELYDIEARLATLEAERVYLASEVTLAREALRSISGMNAGELFALEETATLPPLTGDLTHWVDTARRNNPHITARSHAVEAAQNRVSERRGAYMPQVSFILQQQRSNLGFDNVPTHRRDIGYAGVDITIPLYAGGTNRAGVSEALSQQNIARNELRQAQLDISDRARMLYLRQQANEQRQQAAERMLESNQLAVESRQRGFDLGNITSVELLESIRDRFLAERQLQSLRYENIMLNLLLRQAAGTLSAEDLVEVSHLLTGSAQ